MRIANKTRATRLCDALAGVGLQLKHSECVEVLSKLGSGSASNAQNSDSSDDLRRAEQFVDELNEGVQELNYAKFTQRFEEKFLINIPEIAFKKDMEESREEVGAYIGREFMGTLGGVKRVGDDRYPNLVRYVWRCYFEKKEVLLHVGIYEKDGTHYVSGAHSV